MSKQNTKKILSAIIVAAIAISGISVWMLYPREVEAASFIDNFENGLGNWTTDAQVPENPNNPGQGVTWKIEPSTNQSTSGNRSVLFAIDGLQDDGAIWIQRKLNLEANKPKNVSLTFQLWSPSESFNTVAVVIGYVGKAAPHSEAEFQVIGAANQAEGWKTYTSNSEVLADSNGVAYVALGIAVRWETTMSYFIDDVQIALN